MSIDLYVFWNSEITCIAAAYETSSALSAMCAEPGFDFLYFGIEREVSHIFTDVLHSFLLPRALGVVILEVYRRS